MSVRETWVFPSEGGEPYIKGSAHHAARNGGYTILPDLPDFVSPIDGKRYSGRAGLREHCKIHDVVPTADLKGLPPMPASGDLRSKDQIKQDRAARKELIIQQVNKHYR